MKFPIVLFSEIRIRNQPNGQIFISRISENFTKLCYFKLEVFPNANTFRGIFFGGFLTCYALLNSSCDLCNNSPAIPSSLSFFRFLGCLPIRIDGFGSITRKSTVTHADAFVIEKTNFQSRFRLFFISMPLFTHAIKKMPYIHPRAICIIVSYSTQHRRFRRNKNSIRSNVRGVLLPFQGITSTYIRLGIPPHMYLPSSEYFNGVVSYYQLDKRWS